MVLCVRVPASGARHGVRGSERCSLVENLFGPEQVTSGPDPKAL